MEDEIWARMHIYAISDVLAYRLGVVSLQTFSGGLQYLDKFMPNAKPSLELSGHQTAHKEYRFVGV